MNCSRGPPFPIVWCAIELHNRQQVSGAMLKFSDQHVLARFGTGDISDVDERNDDAFGLAIAAAIGR